MTARRILLLAHAVYALHVAVLVAAELAAAGRIGPPIDDGWIYMAFARALASGDGISYPGHDGPLSAVTGPVWNAILAAGFFVFGATPLVAKACGALWGALAVHAVYRLGRAATGDARAGAIAALVVAATARFAWGSMSVMEVPFYVAAVAFGLALHLERRAASLLRWLPALLVLWLAGWARPECFVFAVLAAAQKRSWLALALLGALLALYPAYHLAVYGHPLPTTFYAKAAGSAPWAVLARDGAGAALGALVMGPLRELLAFACWLPTHLPVIALGTVAGVVRAVRARDGVATVVLALLVFVLARGALGVVEPSFQYGRYFAHTWPLFVVVSLHGLDAQRRAAWPSVAVLAAVGTLSMLAPTRTLAYVFDHVDPGTGLTVADAEAIRLAAALAALVLFGAGAVVARARATPPAWACALFLVTAAAFGALRDGWNVRDTYAMNVAMAERVRDVVPRGETVACHDIGALGFFGEHRLLDLAGLGSPEVVFRPRGPDGRIDGQALLVELKPRWLCLTEDMFDAVMGGRQELPGLVAAAPRATIEHPQNVTLLGTKYHLVELTWQ